MIRYVGYSYRATSWTTFRISRTLSNSFALLKCGFSVQSAQPNDDRDTCIDPSVNEFDSRKYAQILKECISTNDPNKGKSLHGNIIKKGNCLDLFAWNILLNMYVKSELISDAQRLFDVMFERNTITYVTLIQGYMHSVQCVEAFQLFIRLHREGHELNPFVFTSILKLFVSMECAELCLRVQACVFKLGHDSNPFVGTALIDAYSICGNVDDAREVFDGILEKDMVSWSGMIACYSDNGYFEEALELFCCMRRMGLKPNNFTFDSSLKACVGLGSARIGKCIHGCALKSQFELDPYVSTALLDLYTKCENFSDALKIFKETPQKDVILWSFMISRYSQSGRSEEAADLFNQMRKAFVVPNQFTLASVLQACATMECIKLGEQTHCHVLKVGLDTDIFVSNALMDVYAKCQRMVDSEKIFFNSAQRNDVTWNTMIVGYAQWGNGEEALRLFLRMIDAQVKPTQVTYSGVLRACSSLAALKPGTQIHGLICKTVFDRDTIVGNGLIDMYAKCGSIKEARLVFDTMDKLDAVSWNSMMSAYSLHGSGEDALKLFVKMKEKKVQPNKITFVGVLSACSNTGLVDEGWSYFKSMYTDYGIKPCIEHYTCMVWLLGRSGQLNEAVKFIDEIPFEPSVMVWRALLGACVVHNNIELGRVTAERVLQMDPHDDATHVLLSNMYAVAKNWDGVTSTRKNMKRKGVKKEPGLSWIESQGKVHCFGVGDTSHPDLRLIYGILEWLNVKIKKAGYVADRNTVLLDVEDGEKDRLLWVHSERLALAFALVSTPRGSSIRIIKNLRICADCHAAIKLISKVVQREIVVRDINRFHHFENGSCSCKDYW
ncbi:hypothetical protein MKW92_023241 [Papaver armeniacum]|nr:hypothetical protein MKW92_023241 [Papaver armeniacum]